MVSECLGFISCVTAFVVDGKVVIEIIGGVFFSNDVFIFSFDCVIVLTLYFLFGFGGNTGLFDRLSSPSMVLKVVFLDLGILEWRKRYFMLTEEPSNGIEGGLYDA